MSETNASPNHDFVDKFYTMNPETETLLFGKDLKEGMLVLVENNKLRVYTDREIKGDENLNFALKYNRWCTIDTILFVSNTIYFIGIYQDESKMSHVSDSTTCWYVKSNSIPTDPLGETFFNKYAEKAITRENVLGYMGHNERIVNPNPEVFRKLQSE